MDDGLIDIAVIQPAKTVELLPTLIAGVLDPAGKGLGRPQFTLFQAKEARITCTPSLGMEFDGELIHNNTGVFGARVLPNASISSWTTSLSCSKSSPGTAAGR